MLYHLYIAPKSRQASVAAQWLPAGAIGKKKNARALYLDLTPATKVICELGGKRRARALPSFLVLGGGLGQGIRYIRSGRTAHLSCISSSIFTICKKQKSLTFLWFDRVEVLYILPSDWSQYIL